MRAAIYARVSTKDKGQDTENQLLQLRSYAAAQGWEVVEFIDHVTGKTSDRAQLQAMFEAARQRRIDVVLFWSLDRFTREGALPTLQHLNTLSSYGVGFQSHTEQYLNSCGIFKDAVIAILGTIAKQERIRISERTVAGLERARKAGRIGGRPCPIFDRQRAIDLRNQNPPVSWRAIAKELGVPHSTIRQVLQRVRKTSAQNPEIALQENGSSPPETAVC